MQNSSHTTIYKHISEASLRTPQTNRLSITIRIFLHVLDSFFLETRVVVVLLLVGCGSGSGDLTFSPREIPRDKTVLCTDGAGRHNFFPSEDPHRASWSGRRGPSERAACRVRSTQIRSPVYNTMSPPHTQAGGFGVRREFRAFGPRRAHLRRQLGQHRDAVLHHGKSVHPVSGLALATRPHLRPTLDRP